MLSEEELRQALLELAQQPEISEKETLEVRALVRRSISQHRNADYEGDSVPKKDSGFPIISDNDEDQSSQEKPSGKKQPPRGTDK